MRRNLALAGRDDPGALERMIRAKLAGLVIGIVLGVLVGLLLGGWWWALLPALAALGLWWPDLRVREAIDRRATAVERSLPDALDLLQLCVGSGLSLQGALAEVARAQDTPVAAEFRRVLQEMRLGVARSDAFLALTRRTRQPDLLRFAHAMIQVDRLGIPVRVVLAEQARDMRERRRVRAREQAQQVSVRILLPLVVCFLPALFVVVLGPALLSIIRTFTG
jgi:tight adherence protein C